MSSIRGQIKPEHLELFALEFGKIVENDFVYTLSSTNIDQSAPNLVKMHVIIRSRVSLIWIESDQKIAIIDFVYTLASANIDHLVPNLATI